MTTINTAAGRRNSAKAAAKAAANEHRVDYRTKYVPLTDAERSRRHVALLAR